MKRNLLGLKRSSRFLFCRRAESEVPKMASSSISKTNLIINYLPQNLTDDEFKSMFLSIGPLVSSKVVRDKATGMSYGFGFVEFVHECDAARAVSSLDGLHMQNKRIKVAHANKNEDGEDKGTNIYIKNIPKEYTEKELNEVFKPYGTITQSKILMDLNTGESRTVGFVAYETREQAECAITALNGKNPPKSQFPLYLKFADDPEKKKQKAALQSSPQIQNWSTGPTPANRFPNPGTGGPMRNAVGNKFRFNPMSSTNGTTAAGMGLSNFNTNATGSGPGNYPGGPGGYGASLPGSYPGNAFSGPNNLAAGLSGTGTSQAGQMNADQSAAGPGPYALFVYNIGNDAEERELWALFSPYGKVQKVALVYDDKKICKGFGFVTMVNYHDANNAIHCLDGTYYKGRILSVSFKK